MIGEEEEEETFFGGYESDEDEKEVVVDLRNLDLSKKFTEYPSIPLSKKFAGKAHKDELEWVVTEKIHGANFCMMTDGKNLQCGRRNSYLDNSETFYNFQSVRDKWRNSVMDMFEKIQTNYCSEPENMDHITVFGELFGGIYPHPEVEDLGYQYIQKGVYYSPGIDFFAFDIQLVNFNGEATWLNYDTVILLLKNYELNYARPLFRGPLSECLGYDIKFNSTIPKLLGFPELAKNQCEGVVIKTVEPKLERGTRKIFKHKNVIKSFPDSAKFEEVNPKVGLTKYEIKKNEERDAVTTIYTEIERYVNENRLNSVRSKIGPLTEKNQNETSEKLAEDVFKDFIEDYKEVWFKIDEGKQELIKKNTNSKIRTFVIENLNEN